MAVTSTTVGGVNVWQFSGAVTDAEIKTAWAALIVNQRYKPGRYIYVDSTCSLANVRGTYYVDCEALGIILHSSRNKANTLFKNWIFTQTAGLSVGARSNFVRVTNGTTITTTLTDGIDMQGGGMIYAVQGNPGGGDPRYLNEMMFGSLNGTIVTSQAYTEQELQPVSYGTIWRGLNIQKCANIPIVNSGNQVVYRTNFNTETTGANPISLYSGSNGCYVSTTMRKQGATFTSSLANTYASGGVTTIMILNNWKDESYFGASKTSLTATNWSAGNKIVGGVLKKILVQPSTLIRTYDSRSTTASQKSTFSETTSDFLAGTDSTTSDASTGRAQIVCVGAIATGSTIAITRYTGQRFTLQKFGFRVQVETPDMTFGDDDLSAFSPITMSAQNGLVRTQASINAATVLTGYQDMLEELHVLAIGLVGSASYSGAFGGNLFTFVGGVLTTSFSDVNVDATAAAKISFNSATNVLTVKASELTDNATVTKWVNASGPINLLNGAVIKGIYQSAATTSARLTTTGLTDSSLAVLDNTGAVYDFADDLTGSSTEYFAPGKTGTYTAIAERLGSKRQTSTFTPGVGGDFGFAPIWVPDPSLVETSAAIISARSDADTPNQTLENVSYWRGTESGIKYDLVSKDGTSVVISCDVNFVATASTPIAYNPVTDVMTIAAGAQHLPGSTLVAYRSPGKITIDAGVDFQCAYADEDGQRITVLGMDSYPLNVTWYMRYRIQGTTAWTTLSGTGNTKQLTLTEGIYEVEVRGDGYGWANGVIDTSKTLSLALSRVVALADDETPQQLKAFDATLEAVFQFNAVAGAVAVTNTTGMPLSPGFGEVWRATQRIMNMPELVWTWDNPIKANALSQKIIIPDGNPITMYLTEDSNALVTITCPVVHESTGKSADDRVKGNTAGLYIKLGSQASAETAGLVDAVVSRLGGPAFDTDTHGLSIVRAAIAAAKTVTDAVKAKTDNLPAQPAAVGDAMTLTTAYDAAKTAATQTSVDAVKAKVDTLENADLSGLATASQVTAIGTPLQADDYVAPANADIASIKATVEAIEPTDLSGIPGAVRTELATELANLDAKVSTRSTLTVDDIPAGLSADDVWTHTDRTLTVASGLTSTQQQALTDLQTEVGKLLKAADYTAPATASAIAAQVELAMLNSTDGRDLMQAIADKIGNENLSAAAVATAVWAAATRTLTSSGAPTAAQNAAAVRSELATELARMDVATSTRLATSGYTTPPTVGAIRADIERVGGMLDTVPTLTEIEASNLAKTNTPMTLASAYDAAKTAATQTSVNGLPAAVRSNLSVELGRIDAAVSTRSTLTAGDIPAGLSAGEVLGAEVEPGVSVKGALRLNNAFVAGKIRGAGSNVEKFSNLAGTKDVIVSTNDAQGNRREVRLNLED